MKSDFIAFFKEPLSSTVYRFSDIRAINDRWMGPGRRSTKCPVRINDFRKLLNHGMKDFSLFVSVVRSGQGT